MKYLNAGTTVSVICIIFDKELEKESYPETEPPLRPLPKALVREMDFNDRREQALEKLRGYPA